VPISTNPSSEKFKVGLAVNASLSLGFGHAVRCRRVARALGDHTAIYPVSEPCRRFFEASGFGSQILDWKSAALPPVVVTDLREAHPITHAIRNQSSIHISIHDMGLAQCLSDVAIDGSVANVVPYAPHQDQELFLGPRYMITRPVARTAVTDIEDTVLVTLGGGASADFARRIADHMKPLGIRVVTTTGFGSNPRNPSTPDCQIEHAMATCRFAISAAGTTLYDLLATGVPTIAVAVDRIQLRTAEEFQKLGATMSAGLLDRLSSSELLDRCREMLGNKILVSQMVSTGRDIVDGKGLSRVVEIIENPRRETWKQHQTQTSTLC
jgi:spore coat polysaccharide biosynthesis predicted glycosyltransferase SpsG